MIRYLAVNSWGDKEFKQESKNVLNDEVWFPCKKKPEVPYVKIEVTILAEESRFAGQEGRRK